MNRKQRRAAKAMGRGDSQSEIHEVAAFWRNDQEIGLGVRLEFLDGADGNRFAAAAERSLLFFDTNATPERCTTDLTEMSERHHGVGLSEEEAERAIVMIHWMERRGHMSSDDFNGVIWHATRDGQPILIRQDDPSGLAEMCRREFGDAVEVRFLSTGDFERDLRKILHTESAN